MGLILLALTEWVQGQSSGPIQIIPIAKVRESYYHPAEDGTGKSCGVRLYGQFPVYKNYTNHGSYTLVTPGLQSNPHGGFGSIAPPPGGTLRFYCYFNGISTPFNDSPCPDKIGEQHPDWHAEIRPRGPRASFTAKADPTLPGQWGFQSTSTEPEGDPITEQWEFGDGGNSGGTGVNHRYVLPGSYTVHLTVTDTDGLTNRASRVIAVAAPKPVVSVRLFNKHTGNRIELEEEFGVRVTVRASDDGAGALSDLAFTGPALAIPGLFGVVHAPAQTSIGTLQPGEQREFDWTLRADRAGQFALTTAPVTGKDAIGRAVSGPGATVRGEVTSLIAGIQQRPVPFRLGWDNNQDGETNALDAELELIVGITNVSKQEITQVKAAIVDDPIQVSSLDERLDVWVTRLNAVSVPPGDFGTIPPGRENAVHRTNRYRVSERIYAEASILLQGKVGEAGVQARGEGVLEAGGEILLEARFDVEDREYRSGQLVRVVGSLKNVSRVRNNRGQVIEEGRTVGVMIYPTIEGNGALGYPFLRGSGGRTPEGPTAFLVAPDETVEIAAILPTREVTTNTTVALTYEVQGYVHGEGPKPRRARPSEIEVVEDAREGWSAHHEVDLAGVPAILDPWTDCTLDLWPAAYVSCNFRDGVANFGASMIDLAVLTGTGLKEIGVGAYRLAAWNAWAVEQALEGLEDPAARARLANEILIDLQALKAVGVDSLQAVELGLESIGPAVLKGIDDTARAYHTGGFEALAGKLSKLVGENLDLPLEALVAARAAKKALLLREAAESAAVQASREVVERKARDLAGTVDDYAAREALEDLPTSGDLPIGVDVLKHPQIYRGAYGALRQDIDAFLKIAKEEGVIMAFRSRSPLAASLIEAGTHLLKPHGVGIKTVSEIDVKYLHYPKELKAECVLVEPPIPWMAKDNPAYEDVINAYLDRFGDLRGGDEATVFLRAQVKKRLEFQLKEWPKQLKNFRKYQREGIDVNFHGWKQGIGPGKLLLRDDQPFRAAQLERWHFDDPFTGQERKAFRLMMEDGPKSGRFKPITGDIDFLAILNPDGTLPSLYKRIRVYVKMIGAGMQHGESFSFHLKDLRDDWLNCCSPKSRGGEGEVMLAATPSGQLLTTQFVDELSLIDGGPNNAVRVGTDKFAFFAGTLTEVYSKERIAAEFVDDLRTEVAPLVAVGALAKMVDEVDAEVDREGPPMRMGPDGEPEVYEPAPAGPGAALLSPVRRSDGPRLAAGNPDDAGIDAALDRLTAAGWVNAREVSPPGTAGGRWRPATAEEVRGGPAGGRLRLAPYTYLTADVPPGTIVLPVLPAAELGLPAGASLFAVGDQVVVDPGGSREEFATVAGVHPLTLSRPLEHLQETGTTVLFVSGVARPAELPGVLPARENLLVWLRADAGVERSGTNVVSWTDQSRHGFVFAAPTEVTRPAWVANATSGVPAVRFGGSSTPRLIGNLGRTLTEATIFTLCRFNTGGSANYVYAFGTRDYSGLMMTLARRSGHGAYHYDGAAERVAANTIPGAEFRVFSQVFGENGPDHHRLSVNARTVLDTRTTTGRAYSAVATNVVLGKYVTATAGLGGDLVEWLVYDRVLSAAERLEVEEYLRNRAGLAPFFAPGSAGLAGWEPASYDVGAPSEAVWSLDQGNRSVVVRSASDPSLLLSPIAPPDQVLRVRVGAEADGPGFLGFVFGYRDPGHFYLLDWQRNATNHPDFGPAPRGLRLRAFHVPDGGAPTGTDWWSSPDITRVTTLRTLDVPWQAGREYLLELRLGPGHIDLAVRDGATEIVAWVVEADVDPEGRFGYYVNGLASGRFGQLTLPGMAPVLTGVRPDGRGAVGLDWIGGQGPYVVEATPDLGGEPWVPAAPATFNPSQIVVPSGGQSFFRVRSLGVTP